MYVVFEGTNGVGKSTVIPLVIEKLNEYFKSHDEEVSINTFHEGDTVNITGVSRTHVHEKYEAALKYAWDRLELQSQINVFSKDITIADRSFYSSIVYQGFTDKDFQQYVRTINEFAFKPDLIIYMKNKEDVYQSLYDEVLPVGNTIVYDRRFEDDSPDKTANYLAGAIIDFWKKWYGERM